MKYVLRSDKRSKRSKTKRSKRSKRSKTKRSRSRNRYSGLTYLGEQLFLIGTIPIRLIPFGMRAIDEFDHVLFHTSERVPYKMKKGIANFLLNYGYNIVASPLELIPLVGHSLAKALEHRLFFTKRV